MGNNKFKPITGTFIDGLSCDIPSNNWGEAEWEREFDHFKTMGIDTVYIIRVGWDNSAMYKSAVMQTTLYEDPDLVAIILKVAERVDIAVYIGLFATGKYADINDWPSEVAVNRELIHEINERYGKSPAFKGWYLSHEGSMWYHSTKIWKPLAEEIRKIDKVRSMMISPRYHGAKYVPARPVPPKVHGQHFDYILNEMEGLVGAYAFMDGHIHFHDLEEYVKVTHEVFAKHGIEYWSNLETFDRDMPWKYPPIEWMKMRHKLEVVQPYVNKIITFEIPHFLSPNSMFPSAQGLYKRYMDYLQNNLSSESQ